MRRACPRLGEARYSVLGEATYLLGEALQFPGEACDLLGEALQRALRSASATRSGHGRLHSTAPLPAPLVQVPPRNGAGLVLEDNGRKPVDIRFLYVFASLGQPSRAQGSGC